MGGDIEIDFDRERILLYFIICCIIFFKLCFCKMEVLKDIGLNIWDIAINGIWVFLGRDWNFFWGFVGCEIRVCIALRKGYI
jgi:hypothetical protein